MEIQARIPAALCAIHNFIRIHDPAEEIMYAGDDDNTTRDRNDVAPASAEPDLPSARRDRIAQEMWDDYLAVVLERGSIGEDNESEDDDDESAGEDDIG